MDIEQLVDLETQVWQALVDGDAAADAALLADDFLGVSPTGFAGKAEHAGLLAGGVSGPALVPGKPEKSLLVDLVDFGEMPPKKAQPRVSKEELKTIAAWIAAGAEMPASGK